MSTYACVRVIDAQVEKKKERQSTYVLDNLERDWTEKGKVSFDFRRGELMKFHRSSSR